MTTDTTVLDRDLNEIPEADELEAYRLEAREWLAANMPPLDPTADPNLQQAEHLKDLARRLHSGGYSGICFPHEVGGAITEACGRVLIFGSQQTVDKYSGNPRVSVHGPGFSKIIFGDDTVDDWERYLDLLADSVFANSGRGCINASSIYAPRHGAEIADALAKRLGPIAPKPMDDPAASLSAFTTSGVAEAVHNQRAHGIR